MHGVTRKTTIRMKTLLTHSKPDLRVIGIGSSSDGSDTEKVKNAKAIEIVLLTIPEIQEHNNFR